MYLSKPDIDLFFGLFERKFNNIILFEYDTKICSNERH